MSEYPEHEKMRAIREKADLLGDFLETMRFRGYSMSTQNRLGDWSPVDPSAYELLLASYFGIDMRKIEAEKKEMLKKINFSREKAE